MSIKWTSTNLYEHPAKHQKGTYGNVVLHASGVYGFKVGSSNMSCPQDWATKIHNDESTKKNTTLRLTEDLRKQVKLSCFDLKISFNDFITQAIIDKLSTLTGGK